MARTHRAHVSENKRAKRGGKLSEDATKERKMKSYKQRRANDRASLKKEYK